MGFRCRWVAVRDGTRDDVLAQLQFAAKAQHDEAIYDTGLYAVDVNGWVIVIGDGWDFMDLVQREHAAQLARRGEVVFFYADDSAMATELSSFSEGGLRWSFAYDGSDGPRAPQLEGDVPEAVTAALAAALDEKARATGEDADLDYIYDVAAAAGLELLGFRHDQSLSSGKHLPIFELSVRSA